MEVGSVICSKIDATIAKIMFSPSLQEAYIRYEDGRYEWVHISNFVHVNPDTPENRLLIQLKCSA